jgi:predicted nucleic acid-binding Zn ribbon protein
MSADALKDCPNCGQPTLKKVVYPAGVVFKGSGFYTTDYKGAGKSASGNGSAPSESKSDAKPETTKSDPKSESKSGSDD